MYLDWLRKQRDTMARREVVLLLWGGDKQTQDADINRACEYWQDWQRRTSDER